MSYDWKKLSIAALSAATLFSAGAAFAQSGAPNRVAWSPSYGGACEGCDLRGRNLSGWDISNAHYPKANLSASLLRAMRASNVNFSGAVATRTDFRQSVLDGARFDDARLDQARFDGASLLNANLSNAVMIGTKLRQARLNGATLRRTDLSGALAEGADFSGANVSFAIFDGARLNSAQFGNAILTGASFRQADLDNAVFSNVRLMDVDMTGATGFETARFEGACAGPLSQLPEGLTLETCVPLEGTLLVDLP